MIDQGNIETRLSKSYLWSIAKFAVNIGRQLLLIPLFLSIWTKSTFSSWLLMLSIAILISGLSLGYFQYLVNRINLLFHVNQSKALAKYKEGLNYGSKIIATLFFLFAVDLSVQLLTQDSVFNRLLRVEIDVHLAAFFLLAHVLLSQFLLRYVIRILDALGKIYDVLKTEFFFALIELVVISIGLWLSFGIAELSILVFSSTLLLSVFTYLNIRKQYPAFFLISEPSSAEFSTDFKNSTGLLVSNLIEKVNTEGHAIFIAKFLSPLLIPLFSTQKAIGNLFITINNYALISLTPDQQKIFTREEHIKIIDLFKIVWYFSVFPIGIGLILSLPYVESVYRIWTKDVLDFNPRLFALILSSSLLYVFGNVLFTFLKAVNKTKVIARISIARSGLLFLLAYLFRSYGLESVGIGLVAAELFGLTLISVGQTKIVLPQLNLISVALDFLPFLLLLIALFNYGYLDNSWVYAGTIFLLILMAFVSWYRIREEVRTRMVRFFMSKLKG